MGGPGRVRGWLGSGGKDCGPGSTCSLFIWGESGLAVVREDLGRGSSGWGELQEAATWW